MGSYKDPEVAAAEERMVALVEAWFDRMGITALPDIHYKVDWARVTYGEQPWISSGATWIIDRYSFRANTCYSAPLSVDICPGGRTWMPVNTPAQLSRYLEIEVPEAEEPEDSRSSNSWTVDDYRRLIGDI